MGEYNKFKISGTAWDREFELPNKSYSVWVIQDYFEYIIKKHEPFTDKPSRQICQKKSEYNYIQD